MEKFIGRHGDLCIYEIDEFPENLTMIKSKVLAEGEVTGHCHTIEEGDVEIFEDSNRIKYLNVKKPAKLTHQEHKTIEIPVRKYRIMHEREYDPFLEEIRKVQD